MKNILLITSLYPAEDIQFKNNTAVCHYFAKEWVKMGYNVRVINLYNSYPAYYYPILGIAKTFFADKFGIAILDKRVRKEHSYEMEGIKVTRLAAFKPRPHGDFPESVINRLADRIYQITKEEQFVPNYILGHFILPGIRVIAELKDKYPYATSTTALHGKVYQKFSSVENCLPKIDFVGYRSYPIKNSFENSYGIKPFFMCMSGVPSEYIVKKEKTFEEGVHKFIYVGAFMRRKFPSVLIPAISNNYPYKDFTITYVGDGNGKKEVRKRAALNNVSDNVVFTGRIPRKDINAQYDASDVFIMISERETFGLVWLESMARGCITIASRDEGMDGIIIDGKNGFLCKAGDEKELESIIARIKMMDNNDLRLMSRNAIETAKIMTDHKMAENYIQGINKQL